LNNKKQPLLRAAVFLYHLAFGLPKNEATIPQITAAIIPAAPAVNGPVNTPKSPSFSIAVFVPSASNAPNPTSGTVAPAPANSSTYL